MIKRAQIEKVIVEHKLRFIERIAKWVVHQLNQKFFDKIDYMTPFQKDAIEIVELLLHKSESKIDWAEDCRFIVHGNNSVKVYSERISITYDNSTTGTNWVPGHTNISYYEIKISEHHFNKIMKAIDEEMTKRVNILESKRMEAISSKLSEMKSNLS